MNASLKLVLAFILAALSQISAFAALVEEADTPYLTKEFMLDGPGSLQVDLSGGSISVIGHTSNVVRVELYIKKDSKNLESGDAAAQKLLENYSLDISKTGNSVSAILKWNRTFGWVNNTSISFKVYVPREMETELESSGGSISLQGVSGKQKLHTSGGSINLENIEGETDAKTSGGSIKIDAYTGILNANTSGGSITLKNSSGDLSVHTSGGSIEIDNVLGNVDANTSGGIISANLMTLDKRVKLHTSGGSIRAVVPKGVGLDLDLKGTKVSADLQNFDGRVEKGRVKGSLNGGGISLVMSASGGNVKLEFQ